MEMVKASMSASGVRPAGLADGRPPSFVALSPSPDFASPGGVKLSLAFFKPLRHFLTPSANRNILRARPRNLRRDPCRMSGLADAVFPGMDIVSAAVHRLCGRSCTLLIPPYHPSASRDALCHRPHSLQSDPCNVSGLADVVSNRPDRLSERSDTLSDAADSLSGRPGAPLNRSKTVISAANLQKHRNNT